MRSLGLVSALVEIAPQHTTFKTTQSENVCGNADVHSPANEVACDVCKLLGADDFVNFALGENFTIVTVGTVCCKDVAAACGFEVEIFFSIGGVLQKDFHAGIFPASAVVFANFCAETFFGFFNSEVHLNFVCGDVYLGKNHGKLNSLVRDPVHICVQNHVDKIVSPGSCWLAVVLINH